MGKKSWDVPNVPVEGRFLELSWLSIDTSASTLETNPTVPWFFWSLTFWESMRNQLPTCKSMRYRKILKISPRAYISSKALFEGLIFGGAYILRGLFTKENLRFKIDFASLIIGRKFTVFALFYFVLEGNFQVQAHRGGAYLWRGNLYGGFFALRVWEA